MTILPVTYLGSVDYFSLLLKGDCIVDIGERWVKQTARNRCEIMTSGGVAALTVPVHGSNNTSTKDIRIDNSKRWQHNHWAALVSAYRNSPYFDHYEEKFAPVYVKRMDFLVDLDMELLDILTSVPVLAARVNISEDRVDAAVGDVDLRGKKDLRRKNDSDTEGGPVRINGATGNSARTDVGKNSSHHYTQVFSDRLPFVGGLSIVDLLFCEGPAAREYFCG